MTLTFQQAAAKLEQTGKLLPDAVQDALRKGGKEAQDIADDTGGSMRNYGKNGKDLTASLKLGKVEAYIKPKPRGAWTIAEDGAAPHIIGAKGLGSRGKITAAVLTGSGFGKRSKRKGAKALVIPGADGPRAYADMKRGSRGRHVWTKAVVVMERAVPPIVNRTIVTNSLKRVF